MISRPERQKAVVEMELSRSQIDPIVVAVTCLVIVALLFIQKGGYLVPYIAVRLVALDQFFTFENDVITRSSATIQPLTGL